MEKTLITVHPTVQALSTVDFKKELADNPTKKTANLDIINRINQKILDKMASGQIAWQREWTDSQDITTATNAITKKAYTGINYFLLNMDLDAGQSPYFATFKQIQDLGGKLKKGSIGQPVVFWKFSETKKNKPQPEEAGEENSSKKSPKSAPLLKQYIVFNLDDVELPEDKQAQFKPKITDQTHKPTPTQQEQTKIKAVDEFLKQIADKPLIKFQGNNAFYMASKDLVCVPPREQFESVDAHYQVLFHELGHSTGHERRLKRKEVIEKNYFGSIDYSKEELVAELTSAYLANYCATRCNFENTAAYIQGWSKPIKDDPHFFITACGKAQKACDYLTNERQNCTKQEKEG